MDTITCIRTFITVVDEQGISAAARKSGASKTAVSKTIAHLEESLGVRLLHRTTRNISLTEVGRSYYERALPILDQLCELEASVHVAQAVGDLHISAPVTFSELHLMKVISGYNKRYPKVNINLRLTDHFVDIVKEGIDVAIRIAELPDSSLVARKLAPVRIVACASGAYLQEYGTPKTPEELLNHQCIIDTNLRSSFRWRFKRDDEHITVNIDKGIRTNGSRAVHQLLREDCGISLCPTFVVGDDIKSGKLSVILEGYESYELGLYIVYANRKHLSTKTQCFIDAVLTHFEENSDWKM